MLLDFTKTKDIDISFKAEDGTMFEKTGTISAYTVDLIVEHQQMLMAQLEEVKMSGDDITIQTEKINELERKTNAEILKVFMADDYKEYKKLVKGFESYAEQVIIEQIMLGVEEVKNDIEGVGKEKEGK